MLERLIPTTLTLTAFVALAGCGDSTSTTGTTSTGSGTCDPGSGCPTVKSDCIGLVDNSASSNFALRISHLALSKPAQLATPTVSALLASGIDLNLESCLAASGDPLFQGGTQNTQSGAFSWILQFDKTAGTLRTGGATPVEDPSKGYCFVSGTVAGLSIAPLEVPAPISDGKFNITMPKDVVVPVYSDRTAKDVILLPLKGVTIQGVMAGDPNATISADNNCIGSFNAAGLQPNNLCLPVSDPTNPVPKFIDGAGLSAYMDLEQADAVIVPQVQQSLCVLLSGNSSTYGDGATPAKCKRTNGVIDFKGDWCGATNAAASGTCNDAVFLTATFAASSVQVRSDCP